MFKKEQGVKTLLYVIYLIPVTIIIRVLTSYGNSLYNLRQIVEILYLILACSKFKFKKLLSGVGCILLITLYQLLSLQTRSLSFKTHENGFMVTQILTIDFYLLLYISKEVAIMDDSTWIFFGFTAWLYRIAGFIVGLFTFHPIKKSREWYEKGKAKEDARKAKKATK